MIMMVATNCSTIPKMDKDNLRNNLKLSIDIQNEQTFLIFKNDLNQDISLKDPCFTNTFFKVLLDGKEVGRKIYVKAKCDGAPHILKSNELKKIQFKFTISELFDVKRGNEYEIYVEYYLDKDDLKTGKSIKSKVILYKHS